MLLDTKLLLLLNKVVLGITLAAPIGPVSLEMIRRGLRHGFLAAFSVRLGGALGNTLCLVGAYYGLSQVACLPILIQVLGFLGAGLLIYMGYSTIRKDLSHLAEDISSQENPKNGILWGLYLSIANPYALFFWPGLFAAEMQECIIPTFFGLMENMLIVAGVLLWGGGLSLILAFGKKILNLKTITLISKLSGFIMIGFGLRYIWVIVERLRY
jgi:L-lysine exporter family protein LysE/ArgO